nr:hypothetical protein GCM10020093_011440 [Planobispora longispora]
MLPYYYGSPSDVIRLAREAQSLVGGTPCAAEALAFAAEARALSRLGAGPEAEAAIMRASNLVESMREPDSNEAFKFGERRLLFYMSSTLSNLGETIRANRIQEQALKIYGESVNLIDPVFIRLDQAQLLAHGGNIQDAVSLACDSCLSLDLEHRTPILAARVRQLVEQMVPLNVTASQELAEFRRVMLLATSERQY